MSNIGKIFDYLKQIPPDQWHQVLDFAPNDPIKFVHYLKQLPKGGYKLEGSKFMIIGKL